MELNVLGLRFCTFNCQLENAKSQKGYTFNLVRVESVQIKLFCIELIASSVKYRVLSIEARMRIYTVLLRIEVRVSSVQFIVLCVKGRVWSVKCRLVKYD